jgi:hypothetical protein
MRHTWPTCGGLVAVSLLRAARRHPRQPGLWAPDLITVGLAEGIMTMQHLIGELSARLEQLQAVAAGGEVRDVARLRHEVETGGTSGLGHAAVQAIALAETMCWRSLDRGDVVAFCEQASLSADLHLFGVCARLLSDA